MTAAPQKSGKTSGYAGTSAKIGNVIGSFVLVGLGDGSGIAARRARRRGRRHASGVIERALQHLEGVVEDVAFRGTGYTYRIAVDGVAERIKAEVSASGLGPAELGASVVIAWDPASCRLLPRET